MIFRTLIVAVLAALGASVSRAGTTRLAVLPESGTDASKLATLLELGLAMRPDLQLVERQHLEQVIREQRLAAAFGPTAVAKRIELGRLADAEVLVFVGESQRPKPHFDLIVCETHTGLRLLVRPLPADQGVEACEKLAAAGVAEALAKYRNRIEAVVAVPPFVCNDLTIEFAGQGAAYATVVEQMLLRRPGVLVVELAEARAIGTELAISSRDHIDRPTPWYVLGEYRNTVDARQRRADFHLTLKRGEAEAARAEAEGVDPSAIESSLEAACNKLLEGKLAAAPPARDPAAEARALYVRGKTFLSLSLWSQADEMFEASLLLHPSPEVHRDDGVAISEDYYDQIREALLVSIGPFEQLRRRAAFRKQKLALLRRGLAHAEVWAISQPIRSEGTAPIISLLSEVPPTEAIDCIARILRAKAAAGVQDETYRFIRRTGLREVQDPAERFAGAVALANLATRPSDSITIQCLFVDLGGVDDTPELRTALDQLGRSDNPIARESAGKTRAFLAHMAATMATARTAKPPPPRSPPDTEPGQFAVRRVDVGEVGSILGWLNAGDRDLIWTCMIPGQAPARLWEVTDGWKRRLLASFDWNCRPSFDGRYVWLSGKTHGKPVLEIVDPVTDQKRFIGPKQGLPDATIQRLASAPLGVGRVCIAAEIGEYRRTRAWIGVASFDPSGAASVVSVIHEAKQNSFVDRTQRDSPEAVFSPVGMFVLKPDGASADAPATVVVASTAHFLTLSVPAEKPLVRRDPLLSYCWGAAPPVVRGDKLYWIKTEKGNSMTGTLVCASAGQEEPQTVQKDVPAGSPAFVGGRIYVAGLDGAIWVCDALGQPFRQLTPAGPLTRRYHSIELFPTVHHGLMFIADDHMYEVLDADGKPLSCGPE